MGIPLKQETFGEAVYFCQAHDDQQKVKPALWQKALEDIGRRWRMFYFHYYLSGALENLFVAVIVTPRAIKNGWRVLASKNCSNRWRRNVSTEI